MLGGTRKSPVLIMMSVLGLPGLHGKQVSKCLDFPLIALEISWPFKTSSSQTSDSILQSNYLVNTTKVMDMRFSVLSFAVIGATCTQALPPVFEGGAAPATGLRSLSSSLSHLLKRDTLQKPVVVPETPQLWSLNTVLSYTSHTVGQWPAGWIPESCQYALEQENRGLKVEDLEVYEVHYNDVRSPCTLVAVLAAVLTQLSSVMPRGSCVGITAPKQGKGNCLTPSRSAHATKCQVHDGSVWTGADQHAEQHPPCFDAPRRP